MSDPALAISDDDIDRFIDDPALIQTHEQAIEVLDALDAEIANIQAQIDAAQIENNARPLSPERQAWVRRASYAAVMRRNERHRVIQRDKELRGTKGPKGNPPDPFKKEANLLKQQRLAGEVEIRRIAKQAEHLRLQNEREALAQRRREFQAAQDQQFDRLFVNAARQYLSTEQFEAIRKKARSHTQTDGNG
jgi:hypothetical protein